MRQKLQLCSYQSQPSASLQLNSATPVALGHGPGGDESDPDVRQTRTRTGTVTVLTAIWNLPDHPDDFVEELMRDTVFPLEGSSVFLVPFAPSQGRVSSLSLYQGMQATYLYISFIDEGIQGLFPYQSRNGQKDGNGPERREKN